jgi:hypothetical protein
MPENDRLNGHLDEIDLESVEREAAPTFLMRLSVQLHLAGLFFERVSREIKRRPICLSDCFSSAEIKTAADWIGSFSFACNQRI